MDGDRDEMLAVAVRLFGMLGALAGEWQVALRLPKGATVADVIARLGDRFGPSFLDRVLRVPGELHTYARVFVNDEQVDDLSTVIEVQEPSTEVSLLLLPASQGG
ncbi:MAG: MoaD/ThiS family protein [Deltaproteobacteria bacterium]|nr:MoaD/ThiS family protein [Deltaproteobacteria bacterium]